MSDFLNAMKNATNFTYTENGALTHKSTGTDLYDMFALGGAMRTRSDEDVILMFQKAYKENPVYAMKCLFYLRDVRGGQGERRFFRTVMKYMAKHNTDAVRDMIQHIPEYGRWDDLYVFVGTPLEKDAFEFIKGQLALDVQCKTPSLLGKWLKSENTSSAESRKLAHITKTHMGMTSRQYRKTLSILRARINIVERLMSENRWDEIEFDKIPSRAGLIYKNAFARHDIEREKNGARTYEDFAKDTTTKVNAKALYPYEVVDKALNRMRHSWGSNTVVLDDTDRLMINKYWDNLADYFNGKTFNGMAIVDTSGSMCGSEASAPINVAISLGMYCAEKAKGPFQNHFISFESNPHFIEVEGVDFCDKVYRVSRAPWGGSTNVEGAFDMMLDVAIANHCTQDEIPQNLIVISDMEFNYCVSSNAYRSSWGGGGVDNTLFEKMRAKWAAHGYAMPHLVFWNVQARQNNIPMRDEANVSYVSGMSPVIYEMLLSGKTAQDLMYEKLDSERYAPIH